MSAWLQTSADPVSKDELYRTAVINTNSSIFPRGTVVGVKFLHSRMGRTVYQVNLGSRSEMLPKNMLTRFTL